MEAVVYLWIGVALLAALAASLDEKRRKVLGAGAVAALVAAALVWQLGGRASLLGGFRLEYAFDTSVKTNRMLSPASLAQAGTIVGERLGALKVPVSATRTDRDRVRVDILCDDDTLGLVKGAIAAWGRLSFQLVDDDTDFFEPYTTSTELPNGLRFERENAPLGPGKTKPVWYAFMPRGESETMEAARARLSAWTDKLQVPEGREIAFEKIVRYDEAIAGFVDEGWRTLFLNREAMITGAMIKEAQARPDESDRSLGGWLVALEFTSEGGQRFEQVTGQNVKRRFAIVLDGTVESAPVIQTKIGGGHGVITMGAGSLDQQKRNAMELQAVLQSGELPAPLVLVSQERIQGIAGRPVMRLIALVAVAAVIALLAFMLVGAVRTAPGPAPPEASKSP